MKRLIIICMVFCSINTFSQNHLYVPNGTINRSLNTNVGIGTNNPGANLEIYGASNPQFLLKGPESRLQIGVATLYGSYAKYARSSDVVFRVLGGLEDRKGLIFNIANDDKDGKSYIKFGDDGNGGWFTIFNNRLAKFDGNVEIGSSYKLRAYGEIVGKSLLIDGTIKAEEVLVQNLDWPDYVFSPVYELPSLNEVSDFIQKNKHLPGIPSAESVEKEGVKLSEMNAKLLQKIEEMTLYIIQQEKRIEALENKFGDH